MTEGSVLVLPPEVEKTSVKAISIKGAGTVALKPGIPPRRGETRRILRVEGLPDDLSRFTLHGAQDPAGATFKRSADGRFLCVTPQP